MGPTDLEILDEPLEEGNEVFRSPDVTRNSFLEKILW